MPSSHEDAITDDNRCIEVMLRWGSLVTDVRRSTGGSMFSVGTGPGDELFVPVEGGSWNLLTTRAGQGLAVRFKHGMSGTVARGGSSVPLSSSGAMHDGDALALPLTDDTVVTIGVGQHSMQVRTVPRSRVLARVPVFDALWANAALLTLFATVAMMAALLLHPVGMADLDDDLFTNPAKFQTLILKPTPKDTAFLASLAPTKRVDPARKATGKGRPDIAKVKGVMAGQQDRRPSDEQVVADKMAALFGGDGVASVFGGGGGGAFEAAVGQLDGVKVAGGGVGQLGVRGGVGGVGVGTVSGGAIETRGRHFGDGRYGVDDGGLGDKADRDITTTGEKTVGPRVGSLDPEIIRRVVREHAGQVRYCYEAELTRTPGIAGKVTMKWVIDSSGKVTQANTADTQMNNARVQGCLAARIKGWTFPKPKGGGIVVVNYPFVFKQAG